jgi:hypothetical protein
MCERELRHVPSALLRLMGYCRGPPPHSSLIFHPYWLRSVGAPYSSLATLLYRRKMHRFRLQLKIVSEIRDGFFRQAVVLWRQTVVRQMMSLIRQPNAIPIGS